MNELVERLSKGKHPVEATRIEKSVQGLKESIDRNYVHIMFKKTGTELGFELDQGKCQWKDDAFEKAKGVIHLEGGLTLNFEKVRVIADINLSKLEGKGYLKPVDEEEYQSMMDDVS